MRRIRPGTWLTALVGLFVTALSVVAYTTAQAEGGQQVFASICSGCHGAGLQGATGPALIGPGFQAAWRSGAALLSFVSQQMPFNNPGSLSPEQYRDVVAYLLQRNGVAPDEQPLDERTAEGIALSQHSAQ